MSDIITTLHPEGVQEDNLYPNVKDENIPSSIARKGDVLWENANINASFSATNITVPNTSQYRYLAVEFKWNAEPGVWGGYTTILLRNVFGYTPITWGRVHAGGVFTRDFRLYNATTISIENAKNSGGTAYNDYLIPVRIVGIK